MKSEENIVFEGDISDDINENDGNYRKVSGPRKYMVIVIYDIVDNKRRVKMSKYLSGFGFRVQRSCFECILTAPLYKKLLSEIDRYIAAGDLLRVYKLAGNMDIVSWGDISMIDDDEFIIV